MQVQGTAYRTIWLSHDRSCVQVIDQRRLPHEFVVANLCTLEDARLAIADMTVRGAPLIGATAAYGLALALKHEPSDLQLEAAAARLVAARPTAVNLAWAVRRMIGVLRPLPPRQRFEAALAEAQAICDEDVRCCRSIGQYGAELFRRLATPGRPLQILTHCNAGWLATVDWGTALAPIYLAHQQGLALHVWVDETRPRNQGAALTAWELGQQAVPHTVIVDNAGGHLMQRGQVDLCLVGADRVAMNGDVCNKIGTYLKALAAHDNAVPFYVAVPYSTIDGSLAAGESIPIEERDPLEVHTVYGTSPSGERLAVRITPAASAAANVAFDVTPARLVSGLITERGICPASRDGIAGLYGSALQVVNQ